MLRIKMYPANNGDAFLLSSDNTNILIDGGYASTFNHHILNDLEAINSKNKYLELVITTHIDSDHIGGLIKFLSLNGSSAQPQIIPIKNIWHNSLRSLTNHYEFLDMEKNRSLLQSINERGHPQRLDSDSKAEEISARQGSTLASMIHNGGYLWNGGNGATSISKDNIDHFPLSEGIIRLLAPTQEGLNKLLDFWKKELKKYGYKGPISSGLLLDDAFEFMLEHIDDNQLNSPTKISAGTYKPLHEIYEPDDSPTNRSSIAIIIELDNLRVLMLADSLAEDIVQSLKELQANGHSMMFDAIKISHHGSYRNTSPELLELIDSPIYFISSNGSKHGHPDIEPLIAIIDRPSEFSRTLYFNYSTATSRMLQSYKSKSGAKFSVVENACDWIELIGNNK
ncbi:AVAST type 1 anti-phage system MBL fold metallo-hydrolase Avs1a [Acinetobacter pittii]|uniref:AVAST type 1 anti-phage system MBL fold metallo-hydrolase Avs1a n=1 Tax=Acinetobacter pittii TaxID=48296 RepID=UPI001950F271|nr:AVAST type 1 anti-phage system MBL fold metallo-hydrolase Avs1a [Acinetobacter pittii]QRQ11509.1 MBL fold metallo-hydrolase [Acinetobacter pittii]